MKKYLIYITILILLGFGFYQKIYIPKHTFQIAKITKGNMNVKVNGVGNVGSENIYKIGSIYGGKVLNLSVNERDFITIGDLIATIDEIDLKDKIKEQKANIKKLQNDIKSLHVDKKMAIILYKYQNEIYTKNQKLYKKKSIAELDFKKLETNKEVAKLEISTITAKIDSLYNQREQQNANVDGLQKRLSRYTIYSPVDGYITKKLISNFQIINPNQNIIEIVNPKDVWIETHIDTRKSGQVAIGNKATIQLRSSPVKVQGKVVNIKPINNSVTNEREVDIAFDKLPIPFYMDEQATIVISTDTLSNIIKIPLETLSIFQEKTGVWIMNNKIINFKPLKILAYGDKFAATKELTGDEQIAIPNQKKKTFTNGMKIIIEKVK
jgi:RND family efflux transporter MFP subunit